MSIEPSASRVQRLRHEIVRRELQVLRVDKPSPGFLSVTLGGPELAGFVSASFDDHIKLLLPATNAGEEPLRRDYTPRHYDAAAGELTVEFAMHGDGPAAAWAAQATPGQQLTIAGPRGSMVIPMDYDWHLLAGDETALPAVARRLQELPAGTPVVAVLQTASAADRRRFETSTDLHLSWVDDAAGLIEALRALTLPAGEGYAWCAGEATTMAALRRVLIEEKGHSRHAIRASAYWKRGVSNHHADLGA